MNTQLIVILATLAAFAVLGFMFSRSIKKLDTTKAKSKKKGKNRYMPVTRRSGK